MKSENKNISKEPVMDTKEEQVNDSAEAAEMNSRAEGIPSPSENDPVEKLEEELSEQKNNYLRLYAEFENYKKRTVKERMDLLKSASADVIISLLPVLDDFERALKASEKMDDKNSMSEGMVLIYNKLKTLLEQKGLKPMQSTGETFDTDLHDAITSIESAEQNKGKVVEEIEKGYYLNDKVIRHAKVIVGA